MASQSSADGIGEALPGRHPSTPARSQDLESKRDFLESTQRALLNILEDFSSEKNRLESGQRAVLNILEDFEAEKSQMGGAQRAVLNILEDFSTEKDRLEESQRAALNILEDFEGERTRVAEANLGLEKQIEERKRAEEETQRVNRELTLANKELEAFSYSVSHDLRTPLRGIDGFSMALLEDYQDKLDERGVDYLRRVRSATQRMGALIDDLLNLSRMTRAEVRRETVDLSAMALAVAGELRKMHPERIVEMVITPGLQADCDPQLLRAAFENLLGNSWKFTSSHPRARVEFGCTKESGTPAFFVRDDGAGFNPEYASRLFGAFQRLHSTSEFPGTGVGLATVQRIIQRHGGRMWAEGAVEQGASFYFTVEPE